MECECAAGPACRSGRCASGDGCAVVATASGCAGSVLGVAVAFVTCADAYLSVQFAASSAVGACQYEYEYNAERGAAKYVLASSCRSGPH